MAPRNRLDAPAAVLTPERSDDEIFLDKFADRPLGGTKLYHFFRSYPAIDYFPSRQEVERLAQHKVNEIFDAYENVHDILERHEDTIRKRWCKKSTAKKKKLLLTAQPGMASEHRPDLAVDLAASTTFINTLGHQPRTVPVCTARNSEACLVPFLNLEDLLQQGTFLTFLNSRGHTPVESFSQTELLNCPIARCSDQVLRPRLHRFTMTFAGCNKQNSYGRMKRWTDPQDARQTIHNGHGVHPGHGLQILCIQEIIYTFLKRCCHLLVGDLLADEKGQSEKYPITSPMACVIENTANYTNRAELSLLTPYGVPRQLNFDRLRSLVSSKVGELEDHIWALREDPGYFSEVFHDYKSHRGEYMKSADGNVNSILKEPPHEMTGLILRHLITDPYLALFYWHECLRLVELLQFTARESDTKFSASQNLPETQHRNFLRLWTILQAIHTDLHECFRQRVPRAPGMQPYFVKLMADPNSGASWIKIDETQAKGDSTTTRFLQVLSRIWSVSVPPKSGFVAELDDLERMVVKEPEAKGLLSSFVWSDFSQIAISSECIQQIRSYQPWATRIENDYGLLNHEVSGEFLSLGMRWAAVAPMKRFKSVTLARLADPSDGKFHYPVTEKHCRDTTNALRLAEENLDIFWEAADAFCKKQTGATYPDLLAHDITRGRSLRRTAPWIEPTTQYDDEILPQYVYKPLLPTIKEKTKTRGVADPVSLSALHQPEPYELLNLPQLQVTVNKRSYLVFKALFFSPLARDVPAEVPWKDFVHAMVQRGFEAEKLHGSSWRFTPTTLAAERAIQFHAPHGALSKLPLTWARRYGRRLEREYGWTGEMFTLA
ncbi:uncharacterized protein J4E92_004838 [Alternaria infectoria]|uniref:uncharacterized protein n=1 Tax=Alternaria infectoria TaxID=45303 RepID=UPI0022202356|nr:uncharacterized protein J4E92_004838 [Alternaria infectoria]KAI4931004.1 hypothetical protein J4E92_004838 [Alternaria infectoria]